MGTHVQPDITSPVTRGQTASTGLIEVIGTALGSNAAGSTSGGIGGFVNNSMGGTAYDGLMYANQIPNGRPLDAGQDTIAVTKGNGSGGSSYDASTSSVNPPSIQLDSQSFVESKTVALVDAKSVHGIVSGVPQPIAGALPDNAGVPKSNAVELPANGVNFPKDVPPAATIAAATSIPFKGGWVNSVEGAVPEVQGSGSQTYLVTTAEANAPQGDWENGAYPQGVQAEPTNGIPANIAASQTLYQSTQVRTEQYEGNSNNQIPYIQGNDPNPKP